MGANFGSLVATLLFFSLFTLSLFSLSSVFFIGIFTLDFQQSKRKMKYYNEISLKLIESGIKKLDFKTFNKDQELFIKSIENKILSIKNKIGVNEFSFLIKNKEELSSGEFKLLEDWFNDFDKNNREQRSKRMDFRMQETINNYNIIENC